MIEFSNPAALWLLTLSIPLILLYLLKRRRRELIVSSTMLWKQALEDIRAETPFQKLRSSLLLLLQLLILVLITAILSGPQFVTPASLSRRWILVMDCSASMKAKDENPSRFIKAKDQLIQKLKEVPASDMVLLLAFSSEISIAQQFTNDFDQVREKLESLKAEDVAGDWRQLAKILEPLAKDNPPPRIIIASDFANILAATLSSIPFDPIVAGTRSDNVGITRVACKPLTGQGNQQTLLYQIKNFSKQNVLTRVNLYADDSVIDAFEMELKPEEALERTATLTILQPSKVRIQIKPGDIFPLDDEFILLVEPSAFTVVELNYENPFLRKALEILPSVRIGSGNQLRITRIKNIKEANTAGIYFLDSDDSAVAAAAVHWNDGHPVLRFVDAGAWQIQNAHPIQVPPGGDTLVEISSGTIAYSIDERGQRKIILAFTLENSNLPSLAGFPVFLQNCILWIQEGKDKPLPSVTGGTWRNEGPFKTGGREGYVNFADTGESSIQPSSPPTRSGSSASLIQRKTDIASWFLILATGIVVLEWWAFHRRVDA